MTGSWLQMYDTAKHPESMFIYEYSDRDIAVLMADMVIITEFDDFVEAVFSELRRRTDDNLTTIRRAITEDISSRLTHALVRLEQRVSATVGVGPAAPLQQVIAQFRTKLQHEIAKIAGWFAIADMMSLPPFQFEHVVNGVVGLIRKCYPNREIHPEIDVRVSEEFQGWTFMYYWDILFIALDNAYKHSDAAALNVVIKASSSHGALSIIVENNLRPGADVVALDGTLAELEAQATASPTSGATRREGGSGYFKMHKIIRFDLRREQRYRLKWSIVDGRTFRVELELGIEELVS